MFFNAVIFDLDNTLYDYSFCHKKSLEEVSKYLNLEFEYFETCYKKVTNQFKVEVGNVASSHNRFIYFKWLKESLKLDYSVTEINNLYWNTYISNMNLFDGVIEFLEFLKSLKIKMAILTDFQTEYQYRKLEKLGILNYFDLIVTSEEMGIEKPSMKGFQYCLSKLNESPENVIMIGDSYEKDILGAKNLGIYGLLYNGSVETKFYNDMCVFGSFSSLLKELKGLEGAIYDLYYLSNRYGQRFDLTQAAGGNISVKYKNLMIIKSSGVNLYDVNEKNGYSIINNEKLEDDVRKGIYSNISDYNILINKRASMESYMHSYLSKHTIHLHPIVMNRILVRKDCEDLINRISKNKAIIYIDYIEPGVDLSKEILKNIKDYKYDDYFILLKNHGLIVSSNSFMMVNSFLNELLITNKDSYKYENVNSISTAMCIYNGGGKHKYISHLIEDPIINKNIDIINNDFVFPDKAIYCENIIRIKGNDVNPTQEIDIRLQLYKQANPSIIIIGKNIYSVSTSMKKCIEIESVLKSHLMIIENNDNINYLSKDNEERLINMEEEKYRKTL
jgi:putative hydrolase of the HAD superfamily